MNRCSHCGEEFQLEGGEDTVLGVIPKHYSPEPGQTICVGSGKPPCEASLEVYTQRDVEFREKCADAGVSPPPAGTPSTARKGTRW